MWTEGFKLFPKYQRKQDKGKMKKGTTAKRAGWPGQALLSDHTLNQVTSCLLVRPSTDTTLFTLSRKLYSCLPHHLLCAASWLSHRRAGVAVRPAVMPRCTQLYSRNWNLSSPYLVIRLMIPIYCYRCCTSPNGRLSALFALDFVDLVSGRQEDRAE